MAKLLALLCACFIGYGVASGWGVWLLVSLVLSGAGFLFVDDVYEV